jgi:hypothetical protein
MAVSREGAERRAAALAEGRRTRWRNDTSGTAELVDRIVRRAPALTAEQRQTVRAALDTTADPR